MADPTTTELEDRLTKLGVELAAPSAPDLAARVRGRLDSEPPPPPRGRRNPVVAIGLTGALLLAGGAFASPLRDEILELVGIEGVEVQRVTELPDARELDQLGLGLGARVSPARAEEIAVHPLVAARTGPLSAPHRTFAGTIGGEPVISYAYPSSAALPPIDRAGTGAVVSQFRSGSESPLLEKLITGGEPEPVRVGSDRGVWVATRHVVRFPIEPVAAEAVPRLAGHVLIWQRGPVTLRLEVDVSKARAVALARSLLTPR